MKTKIFFTATALFLIICTMGQKATIELTFTAENNGQYIPLDSILIENLTQGGDTSLYEPDTLLVLDYITSIENNKVIGESTFSLSPNYPNPFKEKTEIELYLPEKEHINITVRDILGREVLKYDNKLKQGNHSFYFYPGNEKYYLLTVTVSQTNKTIKMLNANTNSTYKEECNIVYNGYEENNIGFKSQRLRRVAPALTEKAINSFVFNMGDELKYSAYTDVEEEEIIDTPSNSQIYTFQFDGWDPCPGMSTLTDIDGNVYNTVLIGSQCWMKENLKTTTYNNGIPIQNITDSSSWNNYDAAGYVWYDNAIAWKDLYGALYNWNATNDTNGFCPTGWHLPSHDEWTTLTDFIGGINDPHGNELKSCRQLNSPLGGYCNTTEHPRWNESSISWGTDDYGFSGLPSGYRDIYGGFVSLGTYSLWWTTTEIGYSVWYHGLYYNNGTVNETYGAKRNGLSVRCLRD